MIGQPDGTVCFIQSFRPFGRRAPQFIDRPREICQLAKQLEESGCRLEMEALQTGEASFTVERDVDGEVDVLAIEVVPNGPGVPEAVDRLIQTAAGRL